MRPPSLATFALLGSLPGLACDPLIERPWVEVPTVEIQTPAEGATLIQPGPELTVELSVSGCRTVQTLSLRARDTELWEASLEKLEPKGRFRVQVPMIRLLEQMTDGPAERWPIDLQARLTCGDYGQEARSDWRRLRLSPFADLTSGFNGSVYQVQAGGGEAQVLALSEDGVSLFTPGGDRRTSGGPSRGGMARIVGRDLYYYADCLETVCWNRSGTLFHLDASDLSIFALQKLDLAGDPTEIMAAPESGRLLVAIPGVIFEPQLLFTDLDLKNSISVPLNLDPVGPGRRLSDGQVLLLGLPRPGQTAAVELLLVGAGGALTRQQLPLVLAAADALWALSPDGSRVAILDRRSGTLHRFLTADGTLLPTLELEPEAWLSLELDDSGRILLTSGSSVRQLRFDDGQQVWRVTPKAGLQAAIALPTGGCALLNEELALQVLDKEGALTLEQGPLPRAWRLSSNLVVTSAGWLHFGLGRSVAGYRLED